MAFWFPRILLGLLGLWLHLVLGFQGVLFETVVSFGSLILLISSFFPKLEISGETIKIRQIVRRQRIERSEISLCFFARPTRVWVKPWGGWIEVSHLTLHRECKPELHIWATYHVLSEHFPSKTEQQSALVVKWAMNDLGGLRGGHRTRSDQKEGEH